MITTYNLPITRSRFWPLHKIRAVGGGGWGLRGLGIVPLAGLAVSELALQNQKLLGGAGDLVSRL